MTPFLRGMTRAALATFPLPGPVLEIGSLQVDGQTDLIDLRPLIRQPYTGLDMRDGPGVDVVGSVEALPFRDESFGAVIALSTFEHVERFWLGFDEVFRVLRPDGVFLVCCPFSFHIHDYPHDYWRFTPDAFRSLLKPYARVLVGAQGPATRPSNVFALAARRGYQGLTPETVATFESRLNTAPGDPLPPLKWLRYRLASLVAGRRPFAPWLERNRFSLDLHVNHEAAACPIPSPPRVNNRYADVAVR